MEHEKTTLSSKLAIKLAKDEEFNSNWTSENRKASKEAKEEYNKYYSEGFLKTNFKNIFTLLGSSLFEWWYIDFRKLFRVEITEINEYIPTLQISSLFLKDLVSEFWHYYSRQWQPNLNNEIIIKNLLT